MTTPVPSIVTIEMTGSRREHTPHAVPLPPVDFSRYEDVAFTTAMMWLGPAANSGSGGTKVPPPQHSV